MNESLNFKAKVLEYLSSASRHLNRLKIGVSYKTTSD